jgi:hypothetical protein
MSGESVRTFSGSAKTMTGSGFAAGGGDGVATAAGAWRGAAAGARATGAGFWRVDSSSKAAKASGELADVTGLETTTAASAAGASASCCKAAKALKERQCQQTARVAVHTSSCPLHQPPDEAAPGTFQQPCCYTSGQSSCLAPSTPD